MFIKNIPYKYVLPVLVVIFIILVFINIKKSETIDLEMAEKFALATKITPSNKPYLWLYWD